MGKRSIVIVAVIWMVILVAGVSSAVTMVVCGVFEPTDHSSGEETYSADTRQREVMERYKRLEEVRSELSENYYKELDDDTLVLGAIRGMTDAVKDPYTFYYTPQEMRNLSNHSLGVYEGVGLLLSSDKDGSVRVLRVFEDSPAYEAGVRPGDRVLEVDDVPVSGESQQTLDEAIERIKSSSATLLRLKLQRDSEILTLGMTRSAIRMDRVEYRVLEGNVGYIALYEFVGDDVAGFKKAMNALKSQNVRKVMIDLRSNPGGMLDDVVEIADMLMGEGLIVYTEDRYGRRNEYFSDRQMWDVELAVLVNGMSASASEILAGALQDVGRAVIVGEPTFGKGIVQTVLNFEEDGAGMQLTTAAYYTPSGRSIHGVGVTPDVVIPLDDEIISDPGNLNEDNQLRAAYEALMG